MVVNPDVHSKLRAEIDDVFDTKDPEDIELNAEDVTGMTYLDSVILEANRVASFGATTRVCTRPWKIPDTNKIIPIGTKVHIPIFAPHSDPEYWEHPEEFLPERFEGENRGKIRTGTFQPFGQGPRQCLGNVFAKFETKIMLIFLLRFFIIKNAENMPKKINFDPSFFFSPKGGLRVKFIKRQL